MSQAHAGAHREAEVCAEVGVRSQVENNVVAVLAKVDYGVAHLARALVLRAVAASVVALEVTIFDCAILQLLEGALLASFHVHVAMDIG